MADHPERDEITGRYTTGHEWDGIKELNTPLPKWWVWVFYVTIAWSVVYSVVYPSWPAMAGFFGGVAGWNARSDLAADLDAAREARSEWLTQIAAKDVAEVLEDDTLRRYAMRGGEVLFKENCAPCHQTGGAGARGYPTLADDEWLWGGTPDAILTTIRYGIRDQDNDETRFSEMTAFGEWELLTPEQIEAVASFVFALSNGEAPEEGEGYDIFVQQCSACHSAVPGTADGEGNQMLGGPPLNNRIFLYGGTQEDIASQVFKPTHGVMPPWENRLSDEEIKLLAVYVHSLGGGQ
jgi:cytochrome c oxidase cbb3-type subunit 3